MQINEENLGEVYLFLFNMDNNGNIKWARVTCLGYSDIKTFKPESSGQNHRVSITGPKDCGCGKVGCDLMVGRTAEAIADEFRPPESSFVNKLETPKQAHFRSWIRDQDPLVQYIFALESTGYLSVCEHELVMLGDSNAGFSFDKMFKKDGWALIEISPRHEMKGDVWSPCEPNCQLTISISYAYDNIGGESTKYREVPVQIQKQRTVTQTKKVPFWEAIFSK